MSRRSFFESFELLEPIGRGGMGAIWRARHRVEGELVAVKVLSTSFAARDTIQAAFGDEVRAVASLRHPGIISVYDYGQLLAEDPLPPHPDLRVGSPYLVMELADGGNLEELSDALSWSQIRALLLSLLDALAHAHARDLVHRDIKPANILRFGRGAHATYKLADFGIAHAIASPAEYSDEHAATGTPLYMAPEQFTDRRREFGPWTDLYALGCVAYELLTGRPPFSARSFVGLYDQHSNAPVPALDAPEGALPAGLQGWLEGMMAKEPQARFACAADAAWALLTLPAARYPDRVLRAANGSGESAPTSTTAPLTLATLHEAVASTRAMQKSPHIPPSVRPRVDDQPHSMRTSGGNPNIAYPAASESADTYVEAAIIPSDVRPRVERQPHFMRTSGSSPTSQLSTAPPMAATWREAHTQAAKLRWLGGVGVGLFRLRPVPMVGRLAERDALWEELRHTAQSEQARMVCVRGAGGTGKSRLAHWLATRARELGAAHAMVASYQTGAQSMGPLREMVRHELRAHHLHGDELRTHLELALEHQHPPELIAHLCEVLDERSAQPLDGQLAIVARFLRAQAADRPLVLILDDVQWGADALRLCAQLLRSEQHSPVLVVATVRDEALSERDEEQALLKDLLSSDIASRTRELRLRPLPPEDHRELVANLLGLHHDLGRRIAERSAGNPLFAIELVGDWIQRGLLQPGPRGFELPELRLAEELLPDDLLSLWSERLHTLMQTSTLGAYRQAVELAATLGQMVQTRQWRRACDHAGVEAPPWLVAELMRLRLVEGSSETFSFVHGMLREALLEDARRAGRLIAFHRASAQTLQADGAPATLATREQLARHLAGCDEMLEAIDHLLVLGDRYLVQGDISGARRVTSQCRACLQRAGLGAQTHQSVHLDLIEARIHIERLESHRAIEPANRALENSRVLGLNSAQARANELLARFNRSSNNYHQALGFFEQALNLYAAAGEPAARASAQEGQAWTLVLLGRIPEAEAIYLEAIAQLERSQPLAVRALADCYNGLAEIRRRQQDFAAADHLLERQETLARRYGHANVLCDAYNTRAEIARELGDFDRARTLYERAFSSLADSGARVSDIAHLNLALVDLFAGEVQGAIAAFEAILANLPERRVYAYRAYVHAALIAAHCQSADWGQTLVHLDHFSESQTQTQIFDLDIAMCLSLGADHALKQGRDALARDILTQALAQWERVDRPERAEVERVRLSTLVP